MDLSIWQRVMRIYNDFDVTVSRLSESFGMHCPPGCGTCCNSPKVEATVLEMIPMAVMLWEEARAEVLLQQYDGKPLPSRCLFFTPDALQFNHGRCSVYPYRPTLCRLFGYAAVRSKRGKPEFAACRFIKAMIPETVTEIQKDMENGGEVLQFTEAASRIAAIEPALNHRMQINDALFAALEKVGMFRIYTQGEQLDMDDPENDPKTPSGLKRCC